MASHPGAEVSTTPSLPPYTDQPIQGHFVRLEKLRRDHIESLFHELGFADNDSLRAFHWMPLSPPKTEDDLWTVFEDFIAKRALVVYAIVGDAEYVNHTEQHNGKQHAVSKRALGMIGYHEIDITHRTLETAAVLFGRSLRKSAAATEVYLLLLRNVFEPPEGRGYRRVSWKNNSLNTASRRAAERVGYTYEGTWRNHWIVKGQSRDSDWLSIIEEEWPAVKLALEKWLDRANFDVYGKQRRSLEDIRRECVNG